MKKVLVVDNDPDILFIIQFLLGRNGFLVENESNGSNVLKKVAQFEPNLILIDINLPGVNRDELCQALKLNPLTKCIPTILISAAYDLKNKYRHFEADDYVEKPFDPKILLETVGKYFKTKH